MTVFLTALGLTKPVWEDKAMIYKLATLHCIPNTATFSEEIKRGAASIALFPYLIWLTIAALIRLTWLGLK